MLLLIPNLGMGGAQRVFADHAQLFAPTYRLTECVFNLEQADGYIPSGELLTLAVAGGGGVLSRMGHFWQRCQKLRQIKEARSIAVTISHLEGADYVNILSGNTGKKILCVHGSKLHDRNITGPLGWLRRRLLIPVLYSRASYVVTVSQGIRAELVDEIGIPADRVGVINNYFDDSLIRQRAAQSLPEPYAGIMATYPVIATAGRFAPEKNLLALLDVFAGVRQRNPTCKLLLVGQGEQYKAIVARCQALELPVYEATDAPGQAEQAAVLLAGFQDNPHKFIARSTLFVLPSLNEGFPMALGEAMVCGRPVIAADCPTGPREILSAAADVAVRNIRRAEKADFGFLMPVLDKTDSLQSDQQIWVDTLCALLENEVERQRLGNLASKRMQNFTREKVAQQWLDLVQKVLIA